jgi:single-strand DNA-binding protein
MGEYNKVILLGNLTRDPDLRYTPTGMPVCEFPIAVHHRHRLNDEVKFEQRSQRGSLLYRYRCVW